MKLLIRATNWVGDAIMALPALRAVRSRFPEAEIAILARPYVAEIYKDQGVCDELILVGKMESCGPELRKRKFHVALLLQNAFEAAWLAWRAGIPERIGYARDSRSLLLTKAVRVPKPGEIPAHEQFYYLELLRRAGWLDALPQEKFIALNVPAENRRHAEDILQAAGARAGQTRIAIGAGASYGSAKCWPPDRFAELANRLQEQTGACVVLFGTATEAAVSSAIAAGMRREPIDLTGKTSIADLPALFSCCQLFIGNDSGAMHVAAAVGLPVVAVFGPTDPFGTSPVTPRCTIVQEKPYCSPCFLRRCPTDHRCMTRVTPDAVESAAKRWISALEVRPA
ncbi:MAG TPA: lipopolysaccharide heptosyltransferase II [Candidatus Methylomirabilis sp.]|nr:lipopolysaccharide heptosyltransferase II [Candidatus Methylomirabilis sp.]